MFGNVLVILSVHDKSLVQIVGYVECESTLIEIVLRMN